MFPQLIRGGVLLKNLLSVILPVTLAACATGVTQEPTTAGTPTATVAEGYSETAPSVVPPVGDTTPAAPGQPPQAKITYNSVKTSAPCVALTFDDGPHPTLTPKLLDLLAAHNVKATFFVIGENVKAYPEIAARIVREGHEIANHSWSHPAFTKLGYAAVQSQIQRTEDAIQQAAGVKCKLLRPPYGAFNNALAARIHDEFRYQNIMWSVDPLDWKRPGSSVVAQRLVAGALPGAILLAHDIHPGTIEAVPSVLRQLDAKGYRFVTVSDLIQMETTHPLPTPTVAPSPATTPGA